MFKNQKTAVAKDAVLAERLVQGLIESFIIRGVGKNKIIDFPITLGVGNALDGIGMTDNGVSPCLCLFYIKTNEPQLSRFLSKRTTFLAPLLHAPELSFPCRQRHPEPQRRQYGP